MQSPAHRVQSPNVLRRAENYEDRNSIAEPLQALTQLLQIGKLRRTFVQIRRAAVLRAVVQLLHAADHACAVLPHRA